METLSTPALTLPLDPDQVLCECDLDALRELVTGLEGRYPVLVIKPPSVCLSMIRAEDSLEKQPFCLGEALTTDCEVTVAGVAGYGLCLGEEPVRGYCLAVIDALRENGQPALSEVESFITHHGKLFAERQREEFNLILRTQVDFKFMEQE